MIITFNCTDKYYIEVDTYNYSLMEKKYNQQGEPILTSNGKQLARPVGHYRTIERACEYLAKELVHGAHTELNINDYLYKLDEALERVMAEVESERLKQLKSRLNEEEL